MDGLCSIFNNPWFMVTRRASNSGSTGLQLNPITVEPATKWSESVLKTLDMFKMKFIIEQLAIKVSLFNR